MAAEREIQVPDIGDFSDVEVIEVLVAPGDRVDAEDSLITLESEKATLEIPSPAAGVCWCATARTATACSPAAPASHWRDCG